MVLKKKLKGKSTPFRGQVSLSAKPLITLERQPSPSRLYEQLLKKHNLKPSDILSQRDSGTELILVTKNGMKIRVKK